MKRVKKPAFFIVAGLIILLTFTSIFGIHVQNGDNKVTYIKGAADIRWGIDIRGGVEATFSPADGITATEDQLNAAKSIIELRMVSTNITDYEIYTDSGNNRIIVRFPWKSDESAFNPEEAIKELSATAILTFRPGDEHETETPGEDGTLTASVPKGKTAETVLIEGSDVVSAKPAMQQSETTNEMQPVVSLEFSEEGAKKFAAATEEYKGKVISIWMDDVMLSAPTVQNAITDGKAIITGSFDSAGATALAAKIQGGALPFALKTTNYSTINPTLGTSSLDAMAMAGLIAFGLISVFMILLFRLPGFVAVISLAGQMGLTFAAVSGFFPIFNSFTMTLPGIAGMILSIGMGVDANIITASRIKEEIASGKTLDGAIQKGCANSFSAIFDGNITIIIVAVMLIGVFGPSNILSKIFGESTTGAIYSFGFTLLIGVIGNFIMAVFGARVMLKALSGFKALRNKWLYGQSQKKFTFDFYGKRKIFLAISVAVLLIGVGFNVVNGTKLDIQFAGGAVIKYSVDGDVDQNEIAGIVKDATGRSATVTTNTLIGSDQKQITVSFAGNEALSLEEQQTIAKVLSDSYADRTFEVVEASSVDPTMGTKFFQKCLVCFAITAILLLVYIALRFRKIGGTSAGITAVLALVHDVLIIYFVFVVFRMSINDIFIAVILTILGYSLNDTIVIYDRIRENKQHMGPKADLGVVMNDSLNQTLTRSVLTSVTTFIALVVVYIVSSIYGLVTVQTFALPMIVGMVCGCYSSLFIAAPLYTMWQKHKQKKAAKA